MEPKIFGTDIYDLENIIINECVSYDVESKKSSKIKVFPTGGFCAKIKKRSFDGTVYEAFTLDLWRNLLKDYCDGKSTLTAPAFYSLIYFPDKFKGVTVMSFEQGKRLSVIPASRKDRVIFEGEEMRLSSLIAYYVGMLNKIKEAENILHGDYALRHLLFYHDTLSVSEKGNSLAIIDTEGSKIGSPEQVLQENDKLKDDLLNKFNDSEAKFFFDKGYKRIEPLNAVHNVYQKTLSAFIKKVKNKVGFDLKEGKVLYYRT